MHSDKKVIEQLNAALASELTAIVQYMVQSKTCQNWGYVRIGDYLKRRAIEEMGHAEGLIERIVFLDATPKVDVALAPKIGANVQQQLEGDLKDEEDADPSLCMITSDGGFKSKVTKSPQATRIVTASPSDLMDAARAEAAQRAQ